jgi:thiol-disulfide isomerase/thioredoxin
MSPTGDEELTTIPPTTGPGRSGARRAVGVALAGVAVVIGSVGLIRIAGGDRGTGPAGEAPAGQTDDPAGGDAAGRAVPTERLERFDGTTGAFADYRGRPLVVNFWASWCPRCVAEMPDFEEVHQKLGERVAFLGVNLTDEPAAADALARRTGVTYDLARDRQGKLFEVMGGFSMPTTFFVSPEGRILQQRSGQLTGPQLERLVDDQLLE